MAGLLEAAVDVHVTEAADRAMEEDVGEEEEEEEEEEEPVLKYNRFNKELVKQLGPQSSEDGHTPQGVVELISCVAVHSKASIPVLHVVPSAIIPMNAVLSNKVPTRTNVIMLYAILVIACSWLLPALLLWFALVSL